MVGYVLWWQRYDLHGSGKRCSASLVANSYPRLCRIMMRILYKSVVRSKRSPACEESYKSGGWKHHEGALIFAYIIFLLFYTLTTIDVPFRIPTSVSKPRVPGEMKPNHPSMELSTLEQSCPRGYVRPLFCFSTTLENDIVCALLSHGLAKSKKPSQCSRTN
jgi:hypothetical protein